ncbi:trans-aconitate 2-methyltransferase [Plakobranchus ocellatus]|uniref:Trans-aconitate 2-methyltransferase n=1 Tax=Plakobranchus ocellatus TaxID=259542 RepID=A0AAV3ZDP4_9GAST|nr:trans-aconitate 2-methyltransferase [Plakobranchus ocellatus]
MEESRTTGNSSDIGLSRIFLDENISRAYAQHRHCYSEELFQIISDYCRENLPELNLAIDVGCGPGNSTVGFTKHFKQVIGVDMSETQIAQAPKTIPNCQFKLGFATNLDFLESCSVDLVACALTINLISKSAWLVSLLRIGLGSIPVEVPHLFCEYISRVALAQRWVSAQFVALFGLRGGWGALEPNYINFSMTSKKRKKPDPSPCPDEAKKHCTEAACGDVSVASKRKAVDLLRLMSATPFAN